MHYLIRNAHKPVAEYPNSYFISSSNLALTARYAKYILNKTFPCNPAFCLASSTELKIKRAETQVMMLCSPDTV